MTVHARIIPRWLVVLLTATVVLNVLLAAAFVAGGLYEVNLSSRIHDSQLRACGDLNTFRQLDVAIWNRLLAVQGQHLTAAQQLEVTQLRELVRDKDSPVNCAALYRT